MDFDSLKYFIVTAQTQHMTEAARLLNITQPALSAAIRRLEEDTGCQLFDRVGRSIHLNKYGKIFLEGAIKADQVMNACLSSLHEELTDSAAFLRLACAPSPTNTQMLSHLFSKNIKLDTRNIPRNWDHELVNDNLDLVLTFGQTDLVDIECQTLCSYKIVVVAGSGHPLASSEAVEPAELNKYPFSCNSAPHSLTHMAKEACIAHGFVPNIAFMGRDSNDTLRVIRENRHVGLMIEAHIKDPDIVVLPVKGLELYQPLFLYWHKKTNRNPFLSLICKNIIEFFQEIQETLENGDT